jgi:uncharacterized protein YraI
MHRLNRRIASAGTGVVLAMAAVAGVPALADPAAAANCTNNPHPNLDGWTGRFTGNHVNIRTGPHTSCASLGQALLGDIAVYFCWAPGDWVYNMASWTYVYDTRNRISGWVSDYYLSGGGAYSVCPY